MLTAFFFITTLYRASSKSHKLTSIAPPFSSGSLYVRMMCMWCVCVCVMCVMCGVWCMMYDDQGQGGGGEMWNEWSRIRQKTKRGERSKHQQKGTNNNTHKRTHNARQDTTHKPVKQGWLSVYMYVYAPHNLGLDGFTQDTVIGRKHYHGHDEEGEGACSRNKACVHVCWCWLEPFWHT